MACPHIVSSFRALKFRTPRVLRLRDPPPHPASTTRGLTLEDQFPAWGTLTTVNPTWYDGGKRPALVAARKGVRGVPTAEETIPNSIGQHRDWLKGCQNGEATTAPAWESGRRRFGPSVASGNVTGQGGDYSSTRLSPRTHFPIFWICTLLSSKSILYLNPTW